MQQMCGHGSQTNISKHGVISAKSKCTSDYLIKFVETGELPPHGKMCDTDVKVFDELPAVEKRGVAVPGFRHVV